MNLRARFPLNPKGGLPTEIYFLDSEGYHFKKFDLIIPSWIDINHLISASNVWLGSQV